MREYSQGEIDLYRGIFTKGNYATEQVVLLGRTFPYWVLPQSLNSNLPDFALRATRTQEDGGVAGVFGVSGSVPPIFRPYWAAHEITEFVGLGINYPNRCTRAEQQVFWLVPDNFKGAYLRRRQTFFAALSDFFQDSIHSGSSDFNQQDLDYAGETLVFLSGKLALGYPDETPLIETLLDLANDYYQGNKSHRTSMLRRGPFTTLDAARHAIGLEFAGINLEPRDFYSQLKSQTQDPLGEALIREHPRMHGMEFIEAASALLTSEMRRSNPDLINEDRRRIDYWTQGRELWFGRRSTEALHP